MATKNVIKQKFYTTPINLLLDAEAWKKAYYLIIKEKTFDNQLHLVAYYCLFQSLELYLKAYISFRNPQYIWEDNLKCDLGHRLELAINEIKIYGPKSLSTKLETIYKKEVLKKEVKGVVKEADYTQLRYGCVGDLLLLNPKVLNGDIKRFETVFGYVSGIVRKNVCKYYENNIQSLQN